MPTASQVNWAKFRVFNLALVALAILSVIFYLLTGGTLLQEKTTLYLYIPDATGLTADAPVRVDGIDVGKVSKVDFSGFTQPDRIVRVSMTVQRQWLRSIPIDSWAQLSSDNLIGDKFVDISSGASRTSIAPNATITYRENPDIMKRLDLTQFRKQIDQVDAVLTNIEQGRGPLGAFVQSTGMYDEWRKLLRESQAAIHAAVASQSPLASVLYSDRDYQQFRQRVLDFDQSIARLQSGQGELGALLRDDARYQQWMAFLKDFRQTLAELTRSPYFQSDADYANWSRQLVNLTHAVDDFNASPPIATSEVYDGLTGLAREWQSNLKDFRENPKKYLRFKVF
jgi:phospholipid/cholesterol/gamma-HCH transport system substrate-binding protein